jgi:hypothetical protein
MKKPKIRLNQEPISENDALKYKNFGNLINTQAPETSVAKTTYLKFVLGALGLIVVASIFLNKDKKVQPAVSAVKSENTEELVRPFPNIPVKYEGFVIKPNKQTVIKSKDGSIITIPANSIVNDKGNPVNGNVELKYREFRDIVDVFLSGIPMVYDSSGIQRHFESAGMFELLAFQNNKPVFIDPTKTITVEFASQHNGNNYNIYNYNTKAKQWEYMYKDTTGGGNALKTVDLKKQIELLSEEIVVLEKGIASKPVLANPKQIKIKLDVLATEFPEIAIYNNVQFQVNKNEKFDPSLNNIEWDIVKVVKTEQDNYLLHFERRKEIKEFSCIPVFDKEDYTAAKKVFEEKYKTSLSLIKEKEDAKNELLKKYSEEKKSQKNTLAAFKFKKSFAKGVSNNLEKVTRIFSIKQFGIFNSDCPKNLPKGSRFALKLRDKDEKDETKFLDFNSVYLAEKNKNALYTYYTADAFSYDPKSKNLAWTITSENKLAVFSYSDFDNIKTIGKGEEHVFDMKVIKVNFENEAQIRKYLEL